MDMKEKFMNKISSYDGEMFSRYYNAAMVEFEYYDDKIWTISTLEEDIEPLLLRLGKIEKTQQ